MNICSDVRQAWQGPLRHLGPNEAEGTFVFAAEHPIFAGHFPDYPLLPGVYMLQSLWHAAQQGPAAGYYVKSVKVAKFMAQVLPPCNYTVHLKLQTDPNRVMLRGELINNGAVALTTVFDLAPR